LQHSVLVEAGPKTPGVLERLMLLKLRMNPQKSATAVALAGKTLEVRLKICLLCSGFIVQ